MSDQTTTTTPEVDDLEQQRRANESAGGDTRAEGPFSGIALEDDGMPSELDLMNALRAVVDPEIGMNVVELALIKQIILGPDSTEIKMILTTPFCPYAGSMIQQVKEAAEEAEAHPVRVTLLAERWDPRDAGLTW